MIRSWFVTFGTVVTAAALSGVLAAAGCGSGDDDGAGGGCVNPPDLAGNWSGTVDDDVCGPGTVALTISQNGCAVGGTWSSSFANSDCNNGGSISGDADGGALDGELIPGDPDNCTLDVAGAVSAGDDQVSGTYATIDCTQSGGGSFTITKQGAPAPTATPTQEPEATPTTEPEATPTPEPTATPTPEPD